MNSTGLGDRGSDAVGIRLKVAKATSTNDGSSLNPNPIPEHRSGQEADAGSDQAPTPQHDANANEGLRADVTVVSQYSAVLNDDQRAKAAVRSNGCVRVDHCAGVNPSARF